MKESSEKLPFNFKTKKPLGVKFLGLDLSSDAGLLLVKQAEEKMKVGQVILTCLEDDGEQHKVKHSLSWCAFPCALRRRGVAPLFQLVSQRIYQIKTIFTLLMFLRGTYQIV